MNNSDSGQTAAVPAAHREDTDWTYWGSSSVFAALVVLLVHSIAKIFPLTNDVVLFALLIVLFRMLLRWNTHETACQAGVTQGKAWKEIAEGREEHIHFLSESLSDYVADNAVLRAWIRLVPEAKRVTQEQVVAEAEREEAERRARASSASKRKEG